MPSASWYARNKEKAQAANKKWREDNYEYNKQRRIDWYANVGRNRDLIKKYGITLEEYRDILKAQGDGCAICGSTYKLAVDHNHTTNAVRGILCYGCNRNFIGKNEMPDKYLKAAEYLSYSWQDGKREKV